MAAITCTRVILNLFEYAEQADVQIDTIHNQPNEHKCDEHDLVIAYALADDAKGPVKRAGGAREFTVPFYGAGGGAWDESSDVIVEAEGEGSGPCTDEENFQESVSELARGVPKPQGTAKIFQVDGYHDMYKREGSEDNHEGAVCVSVTHCGGGTDETYGELPIMPVI